MAAGTVENVTLGAGFLYVAPIGTTEPTSASAALPSAWQQIGYTEDGSQFTTATENQPVEVAEEVDPILYVAARRTSQLQVQMAETTARNLGIALGLGAATPNSPGAIALAAAGSEVGVMLTWDSTDPDDMPSADNIRWLFRSAKAGGTITLSNRKAPTKRLIQVTFDLEKPTGLDAFTPFANADGLI